MTVHLKVNEQEFASVSALDAKSRYTYFVKKVVDWEQAWGLYSDGWALMEDDLGQRVFPLWPAREYAAAFAAGDWRHYEPQEIELELLLEELLPNLETDGVLPGVFPTNLGQGLTPTVAELRESLDAESNKY